MIFSQINCIFLGITLKVLWKQKTVSKQIASNKDTVKYSFMVFISQFLYFIYYRNVLRATVILLPLLGVTWITGIFAVNNETQVFAWIFAILNSLQVASYECVRHEQLCEFHDCFINIIIYDFIQFQKCKYIKLSLLYFF